MTVVNFTHQSAMTQASCQANMVSALLVEVPPVWPIGQAVKQITVLKLKCFSFPFSKEIFPTPVCPNIQTCLASCPVYTWSSCEWPGLHVPPSM